MPGQYITGNQLYSGLPYGMTQPMGMMNFMQPMMYQPPQLSQQYMPNRGLDVWLLHRIWPLWRLPKTDGAAKAG